VLKRDALSSPSCESAKWHISSTKKHLACSNSLTYPDMWNHPDKRDDFLFDSHAECCERFAPGGLPCQKEENCVEVNTQPSTATADEPVASNTPCVSAKWHMTKDLSKCSNNFDYPEIWLNEDKTHSFFFDSPAECCMSIFSYEDCEIEDICATEVASSDTNTVDPTKEPSEMPTIKPTHNPSQQPTPTPLSEMPPHPSLQNNGSNDGCNGKSRKQCLKAPACTYDQTGNACVKTETNNELAPPQPLVQIKTGANTANKCESMIRKPCIKDPECVWHISKKSCSQRTSSNGMIIESKSDITTMTTPATKSAPSASPICNERKWHPKTVNDRTCSNSLHYPPLWNVYPDQYLFQSFKQCCKKFYNGTCKQEDVCVDK